MKQQRKNKPGAGRPRIVTPEHVLAMYRWYVERNYSLEAACAEVGISRSTWHRHVRREVAAARAASEVAP